MKRSSSFRSRARSSGLSRRRSATSGGGSKVLKYGIPAAVGLGLLYLIMRESQAGQNQNQNQNQNPNVNPTPKKGSVLPFPPNTPLAIVTASPGMLTMTTPTTRANGGTMIAPEGQGTNNAFSGLTVGVLQTGVGEVDKAGNPVPGTEWWQIITPGGGQGFARYRDAQGATNFRATGDIPLPAPGEVVKPDYPAAAPQPKVIDVNVPDGPFTGKQLSSGGRNWGWRPQPPPANLYAKYFRRAR